LSSHTGAPDIPNRWLIAAAGFTVELGLGTVYSWSVYRRPLSDQFDWSIPQVTLAFSILILTAGLVSVIGGLWARRAGPRRVAVCAGILYGAGVMLTALSGGHLPLLYLTYGLIAGAGLGLGYIVPIATLINWFPDHRGLIAGVAVSGVAAGSAIASPVAAKLITSIGLLETFAVLGAVYLLLVAGGALVLREPPPGYRPAGYVPREEGGASFAFDLRGALRTWQWYVLWLVFFLNVVAGVGFISEGAPMAQELVGVSALVAAGLFGTVFIGDAIGRFTWPWLSDVIGTRTVLATIFLLQALLLASLSVTHSPALFSLLGTLVLFSYGGSSGTMAATTAGFFGARHAGSIYGLMLTAWGFGGVAGPLLVSAVRESTGSYMGALRVIAGVMLASVVLPLIIQRPRR
jgi:MFS transporter, OFA family, oxalate/formate antiporter